MVSDKETLRLLRKARQLKNLASTNGWEDATEELRATLENFMRIDTLKEKEDLQFQIAVRKDVRAIILSWLGTVASAKNIPEMAEEKPWIVRRGGGDVLE